MLAVLATDVNILPDWTVLVQLGIFLVAIVVLNLFVIKPALKLVKRRKEFMEESIEEASNLNADADFMDGERRRAITSALEEAHSERMRRLRKSRLEADRIVAEAKLEAKWFIDTTELFIESSEESLAADVEKQADEIANTIVSQITR